MAKKSKLTNNPVNHPSHYTSHPSGIEAIEMCGKMGFNTGNAFKYLFRFENKWSPLEDLKKSRWYINREYFQETGKLLKLRKKDGAAAWKKTFKELKAETRQQQMQKIVGDKPGNIEKALLYVWYASYGSITSLRMARLFIDREIVKRTKKTVAKSKKK
jgi:hypothetical protein